MACGLLMDGREVRFEVVFQVSVQIFTKEMGYACN